MTEQQNPTEHNEYQQDFMANYFDRMAELQADYEARGLVPPTTPSIEIEADEEADI